MVNYCIAMESEDLSPMQVRLKDELEEQRSTPHDEKVEEKLTLERQDAATLKMFRRSPMS